MKEDINTNDPLQDDLHATDHDYDGIKELNNPSPYWVLFLFLATICFSLFYAVRYFGYPNNGKDQISEYKEQLAAASADRAGSGQPGNSGGMITDKQEMIALGNKLFAEKGCIACHGTKGEGNAIGPNLSDNFWIHGCKSADIVKVILEGVPEKGMTPFKSMLTEAQINYLSAYILGAVVGSNPPNGKASQGVECK